MVLNYSMFKLVFSAVSYGFLSMLVQLVLLREFMIFFTGNELVVGVIFCLWLILTAMGTNISRIFTAQKTYIKLIPFLYLLLGVLPFLSISLFYFIVLGFYPAGIMIGLLSIILISSIILAPFCIISGLTFVALTRINNSFSLSTISRVYAFDTLGAMIATLLFITGFIQEVNPLYVFSGCLVLSVVVLSVHLYSKVISVMVVVFGLAAGIAIVLLNPYLSIVKLQYRHQEVISSRFSPHGRIDVTESQGQTNIFLNGIPVLNSGNTIQNEEQVHYAMCQHPSPKKILAIGGGVGAFSQEVNKYDIKGADYIDINPELLETEIEFFPDYLPKTVNVIDSNPQEFLKSSKNRYDLVLINLPKPSSAHLNVFYSNEFLKKIREKLHQGGVVSISFGSGSNYLSDSQAKSMGLLYFTLMSTFRNVIIVPGNQNYFLASDSQISMSIVSLIEQKKVKTTYVNRFYIDDELNRQRSESIVKSLIIPDERNTTFKPLMFFYDLEHWLSYFDGSYKYLILPVPILLILSFYFVKRIDTALFITAFSSTALEIVLIISYQIWFGNVVRSIGVLMFFYMLGLFSGTFFRFGFRKNVTSDNLIINLMGFIILIISSIGVLYFQNETGVFDPVIKWMLFILMIMDGWILGTVFRKTSMKTPPGETSVRISQVFGADLLGGAAGSFLVSIIFIPMMGIFQTLILMLILLISTALIGFIKYR